MNFDTVNVRYTEFKPIIQNRNARKDGDVSKPPLFQLSVNYRSHDGIVGCASSIVELLTKIWPHSIDKLVPETGVVRGMKPVFISDGGNEQTTTLDEVILLGR